LAWNKPAACTRKYKYTLAFSKVISSCILEPARELSREPLAANAQCSAPRPPGGLGRQIGGAHHKTATGGARQRLVPEAPPSTSSFLRARAGASMWCAFVRQVPQAAAGLPGADVMNTAPALNEALHDGIPFAVQSFSHSTPLHLDAFCCTLSSLSGSCTRVRGLRSQAVRNMLAFARAGCRGLGAKASGPAAAAVQRVACAGSRVVPAPLAVSAAPLAQLAAACAAAGARRAWAPALGQRRAMSYFSGSHFDSEHMRDAKNPHLPEVSNPGRHDLPASTGTPHRGLTRGNPSCAGRWRGRCGGQDLRHGTR